MYTIYLVRDINVKPPGYLSFITDKNESIIEETAFCSLKYSEALLHASLLFDFMSKKKKTKIASYIESPFESTNIVSYSENEFCAKKTREHSLYKALLDEYYSLLVENDAETAFRDLIHTRFLTEEQKARVRYYIDLKSTSGLFVH